MQMKSAAMPAQAANVVSPQHARAAESRDFQGIPRRHRRGVQVSAPEPIKSLARFPEKIRRIVGRGTIVPSPTGTPACRSLRTGAKPLAKRMLLHGQ